MSSPRDFRGCDEDFGQRVAAGLQGPVDESVAQKTTVVS
jgi:hypothetical protein